LDTAGYLSDNPDGLDGNSRYSSSHHDREKIVIHFILRWTALFLIGLFLFTFGIYLGRMPVFQNQPMTLLMFGSVLALGFSLLYTMVTRGR
jgi:hypothetical protein